MRIVFKKGGSNENINIQKQEHLWSLCNLHRCQVQDLCESLYVRELILFLLNCHCISLVFFSYFEVVLCFSLHNPCFRGGLYFLQRQTFLKKKGCMYAFIKRETE